MSDNERCVELLGWEHDSGDMWRTPDGFIKLVPDFTNDIAACFQWLVPWAAERGWVLGLDGPHGGDAADTWDVEFDREDNWRSYASGPTPSAAIVAAFIAAFEEERHE